MARRFGRTPIAIAVALTLSASAAMFFAVPGGAVAGTGSARAVLQDAIGVQVGVVKFDQEEGAVLVKAHGSFPAGVAPGFHGFHVHANSDPANGAGCVGPDFASADGHYNPTGTIHGAHAGDMPLLLVIGDGRFEARFVTDRFSVPDLIGRAVIVHAGADNYANVPATRAYPSPTGTVDAYHSHDPVANGGGALGADAATRAHGDAGPRIACGLVEAA